MLEDRTQVVSVLFADAVGFSTLTTDDDQLRLGQFLEGFRERTLTSTNSFYSNTWGDALMVASYDPVDLADIALALRDAFRNANWQRLGFPRALSVRIAVHVERAKLVVEEGVVKNLYGVMVTSTARMEPVVEPGEVYCSEIFVQHLSNDPHLHVAWHAVGERQLAKNFGTAPLYRLLRKHESHVSPSESDYLPQSPVSHSAESPPADIPHPRVRKDFSDAERDIYLRNAFEHLKVFLRQAVGVLEAADSDVSSAIEDHGERLSITLYVRGEARCAGNFWLSNQFGSPSISYSSGRRFNPNTTNESVQVETDGFALHLRMLYGAMFGGTADRENMDADTIARELWIRFSQGLEH